VSHQPPKPKSKPPSSDPKPPVRTITVPIDKRPVIRDEDLIVALRELGRDVEHALPITRGRFTLGRGAQCDVVLADAHVSTEHCVLERRAHALRVFDEHSHNGTFVDGKRERDFQIVVGDRFEVASTSLTLYALDAAMRDARPAFGDVLGYDRHTVIDELLLEVIRPSADPVLLLGPPGSGFAYLARALHAASRRRSGAFLELGPAATAEPSEAVDPVAGGTVFVDVTGRPRFDAAALDRPGFMRVVAAANERAAATAVGLERLIGVHRVEIPPLDDRSAEIPRLVDRLLAQQGSPLTIGQLSLPNQEALVTYAWPDNFDELVEVTAWLPGLALEGVRATERRTGTPRATLSGWAKKRGLRLPLIA
jgi:hypothetical protein